MSKHDEVFKVIKLTLERFPQVELPDEFVTFLQSQEVNNHRLHRIDNGKPLIEFLSNEDVPQHYFSFFLTPDSRGGILKVV
jgi:hypothetical protein